MATRRLVSRARRDRKHENRSEEAAYGAPVPEGLHEAIEEERGNLSKAESVLGCLAIAMESEADSVDGPYYPEVAELARELVRQSIDGLDSVTLRQRLSRNKIKEGSDLSCAESAYADLDSVHTDLGWCRRTACGLGTLAVEMSLG